MPLRTKKQRDEILQLIWDQYPKKEIELDHETPFQLLLAVMFSAQMTDKGVNIATGELFDEVRTPQDLLQVSLEDLTNMISRINYYKNKAKYAMETAKILVEKYNGEIPRTIVEITELPGVGIKTAKVVLSHLYDMPFIGVDTHIHRVMNRMQIVKTDMPEQTDKKLEKILTEQQKKDLHHAIVLYGRYVCTARSCKCVDTPLAEYCMCDKCKKLRKSR